MELEALSNSRTDLWCALEVSLNLELSLFRQRRSVGFYCKASPGGEGKSSTFC